MQGISYLTGKHCCVLIISAEKARKHGIDTQSNVIVEETDNGFLVENRRDETVSKSHRAGIRMVASLSQDEHLRDDDIVYSQTS